MCHSGTVRRSASGRLAKVKAGLLGCGQGRAIGLWPRPGYWAVTKAGLMGYWAARLIERVVGLPHCLHRTGRTGPRSAHSATAVLRPVCARRAAPRHGMGAGRDRDGDGGQGRGGDLVVRLVRRRCLLAARAEEDLPRAPHVRSASASARARYLARARVRASLRACTRGAGAERPTYLLQRADPLVDRLQQLLERRGVVARPLQQERDL